MTRKAAPFSRCESWKPVHPPEEALTRLVLAGLGG